MAGLLSLPENVVVQNLLPHLGHNDILRLRRVCKETNILADTYLWTPKPGHQGKWQVVINPNKKRETLKAFLRSGLPPPSRMFITFTFKDEVESHDKPRCVSCSFNAFFEDDHLEEFMERYSKYVTHLKVDVLRIPFTSNQEIRFYDSLVNLENFTAVEIKTVGGAALFEEKTRNPEAGFLIRPTLKTLKRVCVLSTDCMDSMWNFINGLSDKLEHISLPFLSHENSDEDNAGDSDSDDEDVEISMPVNFDAIQELIERRRLRNQSDILCDCHGMIAINSFYSDDLNRFFATCRDNGVMLKNLPCHVLVAIFDEDGRIAENYRAGLFIGNIIHSLIGLDANVIMMELPALEDILIPGTAWCRFQMQEGIEYPKWPNLRRLHVTVNSLGRSLLKFLCESPELKRPKLEELSFHFSDNNDVKISRLPLPNPKNLGISCGNLKRLNLSNCPGDSSFYVGLWKGLPLLEEINLTDCSKLSNKAFVGNGGRGSTPAFLQLKKLKSLSIHSLKARTKISDAAFKQVFRHLKLSRFHLCSHEKIRSFSLDGITELLNGTFAKTIEKLDLDGLLLKGVCKEELKLVVSRFRCSKML